MAESADRSLETLETMRDTRQEALCPFLTRHPQRHPSRWGWEWEVSEGPSLLPPTSPGSQNRKAQTDHVQARLRVRKPVPGPFLWPCLLPRGLSEETNSRKRL